MPIGSVPLIPTYRYQTEHSYRYRYQADASYRYQYRYCSVIHTNTDTDTCIGIGIVLKPITIPGIFYNNIPGIGIGICTIQILEFVSIQILDKVSYQYWNPYRYHCLVSMEHYQLITNVKTCYFLIRIPINI